MTKATNLNYSLDMEDVIYIDNDIDSFFANTMWALANANEVENIGEHGRRKVNSYFSISSLSRKLLYIIDDKYN